MEVRVTNRKEISDVEVRSFTAGGREIALCEVEGEIFALDGICTHEDLPLDGGEVEGGIVECPWHGARYEVCTGRVRALPATRPLRVYPVRVDPSGDVYVELAEDR